MTHPSLVTGRALAALLVTTLAGTAAAQTMDDLNGLWTVELDGQAVPGGALSESYHGIRIRFLPDGQPLELTREGDLLVARVSAGSAGFVPVLGGGAAAPAASQEVRLAISGLETRRGDDDRLTGTWFGHQAVFSRDMSVKPPIEIDMAQGDRPWVRFMREVLIPKSAEDRESVHRFDRQEGGDWLRATELGAKGYWVSKGWFKDQAAFSRVIEQYHGTYNTPRNVLGTSLNQLIQANIRPDKQDQVGLALSSLGMYFSTASGGAVRLVVTENRDSLVYYITDKRAHERTGLVVNATPTHRPLASSFGKWQNDAGDMTLADDEPYDRAVLELMVRSNTSSLNQVSKTGRSAFTDYFGIMAIEDQRGVMFGNDDLDWGRNMTEASFVISIIRSLSHGQYRQQPAYRKGPEKTVSGVPLPSFHAEASGSLGSAGIEPGSVQIAAPPYAILRDDGEGQFVPQGHPDLKVGWLEYGQGYVNVTYPAYVATARILYRDLQKKAHTRELTHLQTRMDMTLEGGIELGSVRIEMAGGQVVQSDETGGLQLGEDPGNWGYVSEGSVSASWQDGSRPLRVRWRTTAGQEQVQDAVVTSTLTGMIAPLDIVPGSVRFAAPGGSAIVDDGQGGLRQEGQTAELGQIDYASGTYDLRWPGVPSGAVQATCRLASGEQLSAPVQVTRTAEGVVAASAIKPGSVRIQLPGHASVVDDPQDGGLYAEGDPDRIWRGSVEYESGRLSLDLEPTFDGAGATVSYRTTGHEVALTSAKELAMQVLVDGYEGESTLQPGTPSYIDTLNGAEDALRGGHKGGNDCQVGGLYTMETLTTAWLRAEQAPVIDRLEQALAPFAYQVGSENLFNAMTTTFYDAEHFSAVTPAQGREIVEAGLEVFRTIRKDSRALEAYYLAHGVTKSERWAPRASGF